MNESTVQSALTTAFTSIAGDVSSALTSILPIALGVLGVGIVVMVGIKFFKRITNRA
jgi:hypothetical protein